MQIINAIKKLEKNGFKVVKDETRGRNYIAGKVGNRHFIEIYEQDGRVCLIDLRTKGYEDDIQSDYHAGTFCDNISQAIRLANN